MNATTLLLAALTPLLVALLRRCHWSSEVVALLAFVIVVLVYVLCQWLDGLLTWPLTGAFWTGLMAAWGAQQAAFKWLWPEKVLQPLEDAGNPDIPTAGG